MTVSFSLVFASAQWAEQALKGFVLTNTVKGRLSPSGGVLNSLLYYRFPLFGRYEKLWRSAHLDVGVSNTVSPAFDTFSIYINFEPIAVFDITLVSGIQSAYNTFDHGITKLPSSDSSTDEVSLDTYKRGETDTGYLTKVAPRIKAAIGPLLLAHVFTYNSYNYTTINSDSIYISELDTRMHPKDSILENSSYLLYKFDKRFRVGINYYAISTPTHKYSSNRLSLVSNYTHQFSRKVKLSTATLAGIYLSHENFKAFFALQCSVRVKI